ncbi:hypothetical protein L6164_018739 [Bauhinia variegata]|uniref:Uncharacterized protein n=1 Tax=Bauhinia variegata TaxID=167791 RepID=A0ACB9NCP1_BAUVA|nr:hypothetical protein L6164_018739 [Bauhinia variegata]
MACKASSSFLAFLLIFNILVTTTWQVSARHNIAKNSKTQEDKKEPQWLFHSDGGVYIPGVGRVGLLPSNWLTPNTPFPGDSGGAGSSHSYVPGGDDTFVPNPGFEVPNPGSGGGIPAAIHP